MTPEESISTFENNYTRLVFSVPKFNEQKAILKQLKKDIDAQLSSILQGVVGNHIKPENIEGYLIKLHCMRVAYNRVSKAVREIHSKARQNG